MSHTINWRYILKFAALLAIAAAAIHFTHRWQVRKQIGVFLHHADEARDAGNKEREIAYLRRYLVARGEDVDTRERLARIGGRDAR